jgi:hypothetical protein
LRPAEHFHGLVDREITQFQACLRGARGQRLPVFQRGARRRLGAGAGNGAGAEPWDVERLHLCKQRADLNRHARLNKCYTGRPVLSVYFAFLLDWLAFFPGNQVRASFLRAPCDLARVWHAGRVLDDSPSPMQLLVLPLEGLDQKPRTWIGGIYRFLGLRPPTEFEWADIAPGTTPGDAGHHAPLSIKKKTAEGVRCGPLPSVRFGPMPPRTRVLLQRFFGPWNAQLRALLVAKAVATVPSFGLSPPRVPGGGTHGVGAPGGGGEPGLWWWDYAKGPAPSEAPALQPTSEATSLPAIATWGNSSRGMLPPTKAHVGIVPLGATADIRPMSVVRKRRHIRGGDPRSPPSAVRQVTREGLIEAPS